MQDVVRVVVVHQNPIFLEGLVRILSDARGIYCVGFASIDQIGEPEGAGWERAVYLVNLSHDCADVAHCITQVKARFPNGYVVAMSDGFTLGHMLISMRAGASGYVMNNTSCAALIKSLELVSLGERVFPAQALSMFPVERPALPVDGWNDGHWSKALSSREVEVLQCLSQGKANKIIARQWGISEATVKVHVKAILRKIQVKNRTEAALWARDHGMAETAIPMAVESSAAQLPMSVSRHEAR